MNQKILISCIAVHLLISACFFAVVLWCLVDLKETTSTDLADIIVQLICIESLVE